MYTVFYLLQMYLINKDMFDNTLLSKSFLKIRIFLNIVVEVKIYCFKPLS